MARGKPFRSGSGIAVPEGMGSYLDIGGIEVATRFHQDQNVHQAISHARRRIAAASGVFGLCFLMLCARLVEVTLWPSREASPRVEASHILPRVRADLVDRNGLLIATNLRSSSLYADTREVWDVEGTAAALRRVLPELDREVLVRKLSSGSHAIQLKRYLTPREKQAVFALGLPGLLFPQVERRVYPRGHDASHVIGYVDADNQGIAGVEKFLNDQIVQAGLEGRKVAMSLDLRVQHVVQSELARAMKVFNAVGAAGIVLDVRSGEILALSSLPDFDPNAPTRAPRNNLFNRATKGTYELGSVFKMFTVAMALDHGVVTLRDGYDTSRPLKIANYQIKDFHGKNRWLSVPEIFAYSSNIGTALIARDVGIPRHQDFLRRLGLFEPVAVEVPEVGIPNVPSRWREIRAATISYGHGIAVTPLHVATAAAALVNGGRLIRPTLIKRRPGEAPAARRVISPATSAQMRRLLRLVVTEGTGRQAEVEGYAVGGKTGTADKSRRGGYNRQARLNSFVATFPIQDPRYIVFVMLDEPKGTKQTFGFATAGWTTAPLAHNIIQRIGPLLGVKPGRPESEERFQQASLSLP